MRVLWLCNIMLPVIADALGLPVSNKEGWLSGLAAKFCGENGEKEQEEGRGITLGVCFPISGVTMQGETKGIAWYGFPEDTVHPECYDEAMEGHFHKILEDFSPDIVHCFGTEYPHTLAMTKAFGRPERTLIGSQGLCCVYADAYMADLPERIRTRTLLRDFLKQDNLVRQQKKYRQRGEYEKEALQNTGHVTGRTDWDRKWTKAVNPAASYHFMNETLREPFYGPVWDRDSCIPCRIFMSQGNYPIKGLHYVLEALPRILAVYPRTCVCVAGDTITRFSTWKEKLKISSYGRYLLELIQTNGLERSVVFLGRLDAGKMLEQYLCSHVFLSPSSIENSPNSVGEAMLLGMPVVSSDVGGVRNMLEPEKEGLLYAAGDTVALADCICRVFDGENRDMIIRMGQAARRHALQTHDGERNYRRLLEIYDEINLCV